MIADQTLQSLAAKRQTTELNLRREYFQHRFLTYFYQQPGTENIFFKGGTALRIIYNSPRFSEDLDFSSLTRDISGIEGAILGTMIAISRENIKVDLAEATQTSDGYLAIVTFQTDHESIAVQLEISLREGEKLGEAMMITSDLTPAYMIIALEREQLVDEKIQALLTRKKARDFYDLYFILRANLLPPERRDILSRTLEVLTESSIDFEKELKEFLPRSHWAIIRDFSRSLAREIKRFL
ncbi:MAG: nucleotidyl transferase AbiEii/AbiGii toxin family protein [Chloroflexota bacterium]